MHKNKEIHEYAQKQRNPQICTKNMFTNLKPKTGDKTTFIAELLALIQSLNVKTVAICCVRKN